MFCHGQWVFSGLKKYTMPFPFSESDGVFKKIRENGFCIVKHQHKKQKEPLTEQINNKYTQLWFCMNRILNMKLEKNYNIILL